MSKSDWKVFVATAIGCFLFLYLSPWWIELPVIFIGIPMASVYRFRRRQRGEVRDIKDRGPRQRMLE